jgi:ribosomal protein L32
LPVTAPSSKPTTEDKSKQPLEKTQPKESTKKPAAPSIVKCQSCGEDVPAGKKWCLNCGEDIAEKSDQKK